MAPFKVHSIRFYVPEPKAIQCMSANESEDTLALSRSDNSLEIWSISSTPFLQKCIPGLDEGSIEGISWYKDRLFTCGLHGFVIEHDLDKLQDKSRHAVTARSAWCMDVHTQAKMIAVGTEGGYVNLFSILSDTIQYLRILDKQEGRIMCLKWNPQGTHIATGSIDTIRVWDAQTGHPTARMTTGRATKIQKTIVWSIQVTEDMTIISGDSRGKTSFWNGNNGTLIDSIQSHKADVLAVELNSAGTTAYSSGIDPTIMHFQLITKNDGRRKWVKSIHRTPNTHDVRSLVVTKDKMISAGVDTYLTITNYKEKSLTRAPPLPRGGVIEAAGDTGLILLKYNQSLEIWRLGTTEQNTGMIGVNLPLSSQPERILQVVAKDDESLICSAISGDGTWLAYATQKTFRVLRLADMTSSEEEEEEPSVPRFSKFSSKETELPHTLAFTNNKEGEPLIVAGMRNGNLQVYSMAASKVHICWSLTTEELHLDSSIHLLAVVGRLAVVADYSGNIVAIDLEEERVLSKLPSYKESCLTALALSPDETTCLMTYSNQRLVEVDIKTARFTTFSNGFNQKLNKDWTNRKKPITGATYVTPDFILLHDDEYLAVVDKDKEIQEPETKLHIMESFLHPETSEDGSLLSSPSSSSVHQYHVGVNCLRLIKKFYHLAAVQHIKDKSIAIVEIHPSKIEETLPPSLKVKKYGAN